MLKVISNNLSDLSGGLPSFHGLTSMEHYMNHDYPNWADRDSRY